jgi:uncharacterized protein (TIGR03435 family)
VALLAAGIRASAQAPASEPEFDVASVKSAAAVERGTGGHWQTGPASISMTNVTLRTCVQWAYDAKAYQVAAPDWFDDLRFDIAAKSAEPMPVAQLRRMMQRLLAERFQLAVHREARQLAVYAMMVAKEGPKLRASQETGPPVFGPGKNGGISLSAERAPLSRLADLLAGPLRAPVVDKTGLSGRYDFTLDLMPYLQMSEDGAIAAGEVEAELPDALSAALEKQLGLLLKAEKSPVDFIVVDHAAKVPAGN